MRKAAPRPLLLTWAVLFACGLPASAQTSLLSPEKGHFLVAREDLRDANFFRTVVLMLDYNEKGAMGVIVNRPTSVELRDILPKVEGIKDRLDKVYLGGPVEQDGLLLVVRRDSELEGFVHVAEDLYTGANVAALETLVAAGVDTEHMRAYAGYAGWGPGQLDRELEQGSWIITRSAPAQVFDPNPHGLWQRLIDGAKVRFARLGGGALLH